MPSGVYRQDTPMPMTLESPSSSFKNAWYSSAVMYWV